MVSIGNCAQIACIWETTAACPGNAHRYRDFSDISYVDFLVSAAVVAPHLEQAPGQSVGTTVLEAVRATRLAVATNTNLGVLLLLAPLAAVPRNDDLRLGVLHVLEGLDVNDARAVFEAIRLANPAGLGDVPEQDVKEEPTRPLREIMALAAERDLVARQYANGFREMFEDGLPVLTRTLQTGLSMEEAIIFCHLHLLAKYPDSLIARKRGLAEAEEASQRAQETIAQEWPHSPRGRDALADLDHWLCAAGRGRNPGTTSDLVTACLFAALRDGIIRLPTRFQLSAGPHS
jgi:triphosphoribosyl-dephospho-CoA synthase